MTLALVVSGVILLILFAAVNYAFFSIHKGKYIKEMARNPYREPETHEEFTDTFGMLKGRLAGKIATLLDCLGGEVLVKWYHENTDMDTNTFFDIDDYGNAYAERIEKIRFNDKGEPVVMLEGDGNGGHYNDCHTLGYFTAEELLYVIDELLAAAVNSHDNGKVVCDVDDSGNPVYNKTK